MRIPLSWLREFVDLPESAATLRPTLDDLGLVVEGIDTVGEGLEDVVADAPAELVENIWFRLGIWPNCTSSGAVTEEVITSGLAPG